MAHKAVQTSDIPNLHQVPDIAALSFSSIHSSRESDGGRLKPSSSAFGFPKFQVIGHRGSGMNMLQSSDHRMKAIKENSILSFNNAAAIPGVAFVEFDVQVTKDDCPVIFHDNCILTEEQGAIVEKRVTALTLAEFLRYGPQREPGKVGKPLFRKTKDGMLFKWKVDTDDPLCTLQEAFQKVDHHLGFNVELKFDNDIAYREEELVHVLQAIWRVVYEHAKDRPIIFSSFQPDAALLIRKLQNIYPVCFITNGGSEIYRDIRRNSLDEAIKLCMAGALQGIVSEVKAILRNPGAIARIKESNLSLITYGQLNNVPEVVYAQCLMGVQGVIVDLVREVTEAVFDFINREEEEGSLFLEKVQAQLKGKPVSSQHELSFLPNLIPNMMQHINMISLEHSHIKKHALSP